MASPTSTPHDDVSLGSSLDGLPISDLHLMLFDVTQRRNRWAVAQTVVLPQLCMLLSVVVTLFAFETFGVRDPRDNQMMAAITTAMQGLCTACGVYVSMLTSQKNEIAAAIENRKNK